MNKVALLILILATGLTACSKKRIKPSGNVTIENRTVGVYDKIEVGHAIEVDYTQSSTPAITVETNSNLHEYLVTEVINGKLSIRFKNNINICKDPTVKVHIFHDGLSSVEASGASKFEVLGSFVSTDLDFDISGASRLYGNYQLDNLDLKASGASNVKLSGAVNYLNTELSGASTLADFNLVIQDLEIDMSGASNGSLTVNGTMNIDASGASQLYYEGTGVINSINLSGASKVNKN